MGDGVAMTLVRIIAIGSLLIALSVPALLPFSASAQEADDQPEESETGGGGSLGPPEGFEVFRVRGRALDAIQTDVPDSVTQFDQATIEALGAQNVSDLSRITPNVEIVGGTATQASFFIRGVGLSDFSSNAASAVAIFQDGVSMNTPPLQLGQIFDVEDVGVYRGPQSFGPDRNASAGSIRISSRKPTGIYAAELKASLGTWDPTSPQSHQGLIQDYKGALEFPIIDGALSARFAFTLRDAEPYKTNGCGNAPLIADRIPRGLARDPIPPGASICGEREPTMFQPLPLGMMGRGVSLIPEGLPKRVGDQGNWAARGQFRLQPENTDMDWLLNVHGSKLSQQSTLGQAMGTTLLGGYDPGLGKSVLGGRIGLNGGSAYFEPDLEREWLRRCPTQANCQAEGRSYGKKLAQTRPLDERPFRGDYDRVGLTQLDTIGGYLQGEMLVGDLDVKVISAYDQFYRKINQDTDFTPHRLFEFDNADNAWQIWQQAGISGELDAEPLKWDVGGYYFKESLDVKADTLLRRGNLALFEAADVRREYTQDIDSFGFWGSFSWDLFDDFTLEAGARYNWERKAFDLAFSQPRNPVILGKTTTQGTSTWKAPTGSVRLTYRFNDEISAYGKYSRGFKAGHYNAQASEDLLGQPPARPETLDSFEAGLRGSLFDGRLSIGGAAFFYLYKDYQLFLFTDAPSRSPVLEVVNANDAQLFGVEVESRIEPLSGLVYDTWDDLVIDLRFGWLEGEFVDFQNEVIRINAAGIDIPVTIDYSGNRLPNTPRFKVSGSVAWTFDFGRWGSIVPRYDFNWTDETYFDASNGHGAPIARNIERLPQATIGQTDFWLHNLRLTYRAPTGSMEVSAWVRNLEDTVYKNFAFDVSQFEKLVVNFVGEPRTFGVDVSITF